MVLPDPGTPKSKGRNGKMAGEIRPLDEDIGHLEMENQQAIVDPLVDGLGRDYANDSAHWGVSWMAGWR